MMLCIWSQQGNSYVSTNICLEGSKVGHFLTCINKYSKVKIFKDSKKSLPRRLALHKSWLEKCYKATVTKCTVDWAWYRSEHLIYFTTANHNKIPVHTRWPQSNHPRIAVSNEVCACWSYTYEFKWLLCFTSCIVNYCTGTNITSYCTAFFKMISSVC